MKSKTAACYVRGLLTFCGGFGLGYLINMSLYTILYTTKDARYSILSTMGPLLAEQRNLAPYKILIEGVTDKMNIENSSPTPSLLCYLLVGPQTHKSALHISNTWGKRCDKLLFFSSGEDESLPTIALNVTEGYKHLWIKSREAILYLYKRYSDQYQWFLKADDDTYVIVENLRFFLNQSDFRNPVYYGVKFKKFVRQGYMSGGGGYVLSREALKRFALRAPLFHNDTHCPFYAATGAEDLNIGKCLEAVGVAAGDSLDNKGLPRFFSHSPAALFFKAPIINRLHWYWRYVWHKHNVGPECCSHELISFHDVDPRTMWAIDSLLYRVKVHTEFSMTSTDSRKVTDLVEDKKKQSEKKEQRSGGIDTIKILDELLQKIDERENEIS